MKRECRLSLAIALVWILFVAPIMASTPVRVNVGGRRSSPRKPTRETKSGGASEFVSRAKLITAVPTQTTATISGQSTTLMPDGRWLLIGGESQDGPLNSAALKDERNGKTIALASRLSRGRAWHSATLLPDGNVLILGGVGAKGERVIDAELFNSESQQFQTISIRGLIARAGHSATLLMDGRVVITGGLSNNQVSGSVELFDPQTRSAALLPVTLINPRQKHTANLLPDGNVLLWGGMDTNTHDLDSGEIFDVEHQTLTLAADYARRFDDVALYMTGSSPRDGEASVPKDTRIALRFSKPLRVETVNSTTVSLSGPQGSLATKIVPAESGMLVFVTPQTALEATSMYTLTVSGASDKNNTLLPPTSLTFMTVGSEKIEHVPPGHRHANMQDKGPVEFDNLKPGEKGETKWRKLAALQADAGVTALAGQVLKVNGQPLSNVTLQIEERAVRTDSTGRFLLTNIPAGHQEMLVNGATASHPGKLYATCENGVDIAAGKTTILPYTIWLPVVDTQHATEIPVPTTREVVATNPLLPGLEMHIPAGVRLRTHDGSYLTSMAITPVPLDRTPIPLPPGTDFYFTPQAHDSVVETVDGRPSPGIRVIYPNVSNLAPGTQVDLYDYSTQKGWYVYGQGTVTPDRKQVVPNPGVGLQRLTCNNSMGTPGVPGVGPAAGNGTIDGDPVDLGTGLFVDRKTDVVLPDTIPITLTRTYRQNDSANRVFGYGATHPYEMYLWIGFGSYFDLVLPDGGKIHYLETTPGSGVYQHTATPTKFYKSTLTSNTLEGGYDVKLLDGTIYHFFATTICCNQLVHVWVTGLSWVQDRYGNRLTITRDTSLRINKITTPNGRWVSFIYDTSNRITQAQDSIGRTIGYTYDGNGCLWKVADTKGGVTEYTYDTSHRMLTLKDARGIVYLTNEYDVNGRVSRQTQADTGVYQFAYTVDINNQVTQTNVTDPRLNVRRVTFNSMGYTLTDTFALGKPEQQVYTYTRQIDSNAVLIVTDPLSRQTKMTYDTQGNVTSITRMFGTTDAVTTTFTYEPRFNQVATVTDPLNHTVTYAYNGRGNLASITDALGHKANFGYNPAAQVISFTNALGHTTQFGYDGGTLTRVTDPLGRTSRYELDGAGRITRVTDPLGVSANYRFDNLNRTTQATDRSGANTSLGYDPNGNILNVTDSANSVTSYTYDNMDRVNTRRDPLLHDQTYQYDLNGNLKQTTDRKGQVTNFTYDALNRLSQVAFADTSTRTYVYDAANRLSQIVDSQSGTINYGYDNMDRLTSETTSQGSLTYTYDAAGRRSTMTVAGQATVNYTFDDSNRLTQISQGSAIVSFAYDAMGRRTSLTLPNGLVTEYGYDAASQLTSLTYKQGTNIIGNLNYEYDLGGRRTRVGGSFARSLSPLPAAATYNAANQMLSFASKTLSYDLNGNLTSDGTNTYSWDVRDRLVSINGTTANANFQYDAAGRRSSRTVNGGTTTFLYDGSNIVQEQSSQSGNANLLNGGIDELFSRNDSSGAWSRLADGLGSSMGFADSSGIMQTEYSYGVFGQNATTGIQNNNGSQYTGRENDGTALQYNRARYYSPELQRFISEDPAGLNGGTNLYAYVNNSPTNFVDPQGLDVEVIIWNPTFLEGFNGLGGHVSYNIDGVMYSWEGHGWAAPQSAASYIQSNMQFRSGMGYQIDFGSAEKNKAFEDAIKHGYDGAPPRIGFPFPSSPYNLITNNCGNAFCNAANSGQFGLPPDNHIAPWGHRDYIESYLPIKSRYYYPYLGGRSCAEYSTAPGGISGFFNKLAGDIGNLYGYY